MEQIENKVNNTLKCFANKYSSNISIARTIRNVRK